MESWRKVWREGIAPQLSTKALEELRYGLERDSDFLLQGATTSPPPMQSVLDWPCEGNCIITYGAWMADECNTVGECEEYFAKVCFEADSRLGEPAAVRYFINWYDDAPRDEMRREMMREVTNELQVRWEEQYGYEPIEGSLNT